MLSKFLGQMVMAIYNQTYGVSAIADTIVKYNTVTDQALQMNVFVALTLTIKTLAFGITILLYFIDLMGKVTEKNFSPEQFLKATLRCVTAYMFIMNADTIVGLLIDIGGAIVTGSPDIDPGYSLFGSDDQGRVNKIMLINGIAKMGWGDTIAYIVSSILPWLLSMIGEVIIQIILISRILEIVVMTLFAPLSIADIYREGTTSPGVQYMKKMLALGLQVTVIMMVNLATQSIISAIIGADAGGTISGLLQQSEYSGDMETALANGSLVFTKDSIIAFINALTWKQDTLKVLGIMLARLGLIWNSMPLCEEITGSK